VSQPGVLHCEAHFPQGTGVLIYDSSVVTAEALARVITEKTKYPTTVKLDRPVQ